MRTIKSRGVERQQILWFVCTAILVIAVLFGGSALSSYLATILPETLLNLVMAVIGSMWSLGPASLAIVTALAILRYRLFDIELIIRRTLVYSTVIATLTLVYFGSVAVLQSLLTGISGRQSAFATVLSTLAIVVLFNPLRRRVQDTVDRRFYRRRYDAEQTMESFSTAARSEMDLETLSSRLENVIQETLQPKQVILWMRLDQSQEEGDDQRSF